MRDLVSTDHGFNPGNKLLLDGKPCIVVGVGRRGLVVQWGPGGETQLLTDDEVVRVKRDS